MTTAGNRPGADLDVPLLHDEPHDCPYLPGRQAAEEFTICVELAPRAYQRLMDQGFRRSGCLVYRPICRGCRECVQMRVPVDAFRPSRSQRRAWRRNRDVRVEIGAPRCTDEKWRLFSAYLAYQHDGTMSDERAGFESFLYDSPTDTVEMIYRVGRRIIGVGIVDRCPDCLSSVFFYFDPAEARRSPGIYSALFEIDLCRSSGRAWWYAGYYVRDCRSMNYKARFRPYELLGPDGVWRPGRVEAAPRDAARPPAGPERNASP